VGDRHLKFHEFRDNLRHILDELELSARQIADQLGPAGSR
jgi:hypothetical protein